jgi:hypothetical protein
MRNPSLGGNSLQGEDTRLLLLRGLAREGEREREREGERGRERERGREGGVRGVQEK